MIDFAEKVRINKKLIKLWKQFYLRDTILSTSM